jgi:anthranilate synthase/aminodeoxychorismate synthase-like glutamine amidotransferase
MLLVVDNHDSFTWNLVHLLGRFAADVQVVQSDAVTLDEVVRLRPRGIVLAPGPGRPEQVGVAMQIVRTLGPTVPLLGVCLGHQVICAALGARVVHAARLMHGRTSLVRHDGQGVFDGVPSPIEVARYHSLLVDVSSLPDVLVPTAFTDEGELMAVRHTVHPIEGIQFHPESYLTACGAAIAGHFVGRLAQAADPVDAGKLGA